MEMNREYFEQGSRGMDINRSHWMPPEVIRTCTNPSCHVDFQKGRRKHHCRCCGNVFCSECAAYVLPLNPISAMMDPQGVRARVCVLCYERAQNEGMPIDDDDDDSPSLFGFNGRNAPSDASAAAPVHNPEASSQASRVNLLPPSCLEEDVFVHKPRVRKMSIDIDAVCVDSFERLRFDVASSVQLESPSMSRQRSTSRRRFHTLAVELDFEGGNAGRGGGGADAERSPGRGGGGGRGVGGGGEDGEASGRESSSSGQLGREGGSHKIMSGMRGAVVEETEEDEEAEGGRDTPGSVRINRHWDGGREFGRRRVGSMRDEREEEQVEEEGRGVGRVSSGKGSDDNDDDDHDDDANVLMLGDESQAVAPRILLSGVKPVAVEDLLKAWEKGESYLDNSSLSPIGTFSSIPLYSIPRQHEEEDDEHDVPSWSHVQRSLDEEWTRGKDGVEEGNEESPLESDAASSRKGSTERGSFQGQSGHEDDATSSLEQSGPSNESRDRLARAGSAGLSEGSRRKGKRAEEDSQKHSEEEEEKEEEEEEEEEESEERERNKEGQVGQDKTKKSLLEWTTADVKSWLKSTVAFGNGREEAVADRFESFGIDGLALLGLSRAHPAMAAMREADVLAFQMATQVARRKLLSDDVAGGAAASSADGYPPRPATANSALPRRLQPSTLSTSSPTSLSRQSSSSSLTKQPPLLSSSSSVPPKSSAHNRSSSSSSWVFPWAPQKAADEAELPEVAQEVENLKAEISAAEERETTVRAQLSHLDDILKEAVLSEYMHSRMRCSPLLSDATSLEASDWQPAFVVLFPLKLCCFAHATDLRPRMTWPLTSVESFASVSQTNHRHRHHHHHKPNGATHPHEVEEDEEEWHVFHVTSSKGQRLELATRSQVKLHLWLATIQDLIANAAKRRSRSMSMGGILGRPPPS